MADTTIHGDESLPELLASRARSSSDLRLALDVAVGLAAAIVAVWWHPTGWVAALSAALCFAAFGAWGLADRALRVRHETIELIPRPRRVPDGALVAVRVAAAGVGTAAAVTLALSLLAASLGTWIS